MTLALSPRTQARLARLLTLSDADSSSEVIRRSLALYEAILEAQGDGYEVALLGEKAKVIKMIKIV
jgi:hypothetical protein